MLREAFTELLEDNMDKVQELFDKVAEKNPQKALELMLKLSEFFDSCSKELGFEPEGDTSLFAGCSKPVITYNE